MSGRRHLGLSKGRKRLSAIVEDPTHLTRAANAAKPTAKRISKPSEKKTSEVKASLMKASEKKANAKKNTKAAEKKAAEKKTIEKLTLAERKPASIFARARAKSSRNKNYPVININDSDDHSVSSIGSLSMPKLHPKLRSKKRPHNSSIESVLSGFVNS